jgi:CheY-like chemotaxis protein
VEGILVISREEAVRRVLAAELSSSGHRCESAEDGDRAFERIARRAPTMAIADMTCADEEDLLFVALLRKRHPDIAVVTFFQGRARFAYGKDEKVVDFDGSLPPVAILNDALAWASSLRLLHRWKPPFAQA